MAATVAQEEQPISRTYQYRKVMKPMLERKRRARINRCLDELKELLVGALQAEGESVSRLEKADVLELTVRHLHKLRRNQQISEGRFRDGYLHCLNEVSKYVSNTATGHSLDISTRLLTHLDQCIRSVESTHPQQHLIHPQSIAQGSPSQLSPGYPVPSGAMISPVGPSASGGGLNLLTSYTPPTSPVSSTSPNGVQKLYYVPSSSVGGSSASSTGSLSPIPPAHYNPSNNSSFYASHSSSHNQPLSLCTKSLNPDEPFDLSNNVWRPW